MFFRHTPKRNPPFTGLQCRTSPRNAVASASLILTARPASTIFGDRMPKPCSEASTSLTVVKTEPSSTSQDIFAVRSNAHLGVKRWYLISGLTNEGSSSSIGALLALLSVTSGGESAGEREESSFDSSTNSMKHTSQVMILLSASGGQSRGSGVSRLQMKQTANSVEGLNEPRIQ